MLWTPHVTVASIAEQDGRFLLIEEVGESAGLVFNQPAGHWDEGESLRSRCRREGVLDPDAIAVTKQPLICHKTVSR